MLIQFICEGYFCNSLLPGVGYEQLRIVSSEAHAWGPRPIPLDGFWGFIQKNNWVVGVINIPQDGVPVDDLLVLLLQIVWDEQKVSLVISQYLLNVIEPHRQRSNGVPPYKRIVIINVSLVRKQQKVVVPILLIVVQLGPPGEHPGDERGQGVINIQIRNVVWIYSLIAIVYFCKHFINVFCPFHVFPPLVHPLSLEDEERRHNQK